MVLTAPARDVPPVEPGASSERRLAPSLLAAVIGYVVVGITFLWPAVSSCETVVFGPRGDATAGGLRTAWTYQQLGGWPFHAWTTWSAAPGGEEFWFPYRWSSLFTELPLWAFGKVTTAACSWNLTILLGLVSSATATFVLVCRVVRFRSVAFLAGLAWGYSAFHQMQAQFHVSYVHSQLLPLIVLAALSLWERPRAQVAVALGLFVAAYCYTEPYGPVFVAVTVGGTVLGLALAGWRRPVDPRRRARRRTLALAGAVSALAVVPLGLALLALRSRTGLSNAVHRPFDEVRFWTASPLDFLLWPRDNPLLGEIAGGWRDRNLSGNFIEKTLSIGLGMLALAVVGVRRGLRSEAARRTPLGLPTRTPVVAMLTLAGLALWATLPPDLPVPGLSIIHGVLPFWRVYARIGMLTHLAVVVLGALGLASVLDQLRRSRRTLAVVVVGAVTMIETATVPGAATFDLSAAPPGYRWLAAQTDARIIAEYPLDSPRMQPDGQFQTFQPIHGKRLFNASVHWAPSVPLQEAMIGLGDPQTPGLLRAMGVDRVVVHRLLYPGLSGSGELPAGYRLVHSTVASTPKASELKDLWERAFAVMEVLVVDPGPPAEVAATIGPGFDPPDYVGWRSVVWTQERGRLPVVDLGAPTIRAEVSFDLRSAVGEEEVVVSDRTGERWRGRVRDPERVPLRFEVAVGDELEVHVQGPPPPGGGIRVGIERLAVEPVR